jgi:hypothetical protein
MIYIILLFSKSKEHASPSIDNNEAVIQCNHIIIPLDTDNAIYKLDESLIANGCLEREKEPLSSVWSDS